MVLPVVHSLQFQPKIVSVMQFCLLADVQYAWNVSLRHMQKDVWSCASANPRRRLRHIKLSGRIKLLTRQSNMKLQMRSTSNENCLSLIWKKLGRQLDGATNDTEVMVLYCSTTKKQFVQGGNVEYLFDVTIKVMMMDLHGFCVLFTRFMSKALWILYIPYSMGILQLWIQSRLTLQGSHPFVCQPPCTGSTDKIRHK